MKLAHTALTSTQTTEQTGRQDGAKLKKALKDFEAVFMGQILKEMRKTIPKGGLFASGPQENMMRDLLDEQWARELASGPGMGLAESLYRQMQTHS